LNKYNALTPITNFRSLLVFKKTIQGFVGVPKLLEFKVRTYTAGKFTELIAEQAGDIKSDCPSTWHKHKPV